MRLFLARGHYGVGDAVERIEHMIDDPVVYHVVPLIARVEAAAVRSWRMIRLRSSRNAGRLVVPDRGRALASPR